ncbi:putative tyrosine-protein phosphatase [Tritrichomonas foetus]|uniref:protein-tyrosine-phosphatase n=1 Tax=Tritrichomonas foetus TaxID=1144522 RepID=A0A1J4K008_9EUKA|nr:putative tyrosine-protein phosphatase [Tritrichomonas foetus]|eukprot:OHT04072.1 putative tyrosine-protein phosphatase [Tritrichomonas foetus]
MNFSFLQTLQLKTVVYLSADEPTQIFSEFLAEQGIELIQITGGEANVYGQRISEQLVLDAFHVMLNPDRYPVIVMCNLGRHRTGTVIACLRRLQLWSLSSIVDEFRRYTGQKQSSLHEQFIELFDVELVELPKDASKLPFKIRSKQITGAHQTQSNTSDQGSKRHINFIFGPRTH